MRHFYKLLAGPVNTPLMVDIMGRQTELFDENGEAKSLPPDAKKMALGIMQLVNGTSLTKANVVRIGHDKKVFFPKDESATDHYIAPLSGQVICLINDEAPAFNAGEIWWIDHNWDAVMVNKSGDDAIVLIAGIGTF